MPTPPAAPSTSSVSRLRVGAVDERMVRGAVGEQERGRGDEVHALRDPDEARGIHRDLLGKGAVGAEGDDPVARLDAGHALAQRLDHARHLAAGRKGSGGFTVLVLDHEHVGKLTLAAFTATTTCPLPATGSATSSTTRDSGGPNCLHRTAFIRPAAGCGSRGWR